MNILLHKLYKNSLLTEKLYKLSKEEKKAIVTELLKDRSMRQLEKEIGIPKSTIQDWSSGRQDNTKAGMHVSLTMMIRRLKFIEIKDKMDYILLTEICSLAQDLIKKNEEYKHEDKEDKLK